MLSTLRVHDLTALKESIGREIARLLNTRCPIREDRNGTVIDYGLPDFSWMSAASADDRQALALVIARKVTVFEPRLREVRVTIEPDAEDPRAVVGTIQATIVVASLSEPVSFPVAIRNKTGEVLVNFDPHPGYGY
jgi:type VI secretion system lysozyme-like protein